MKLLKNFGTLIFTKQESLHLQASQLFEKIAQRVELKILGKNQGNTLHSF